MWTKIPKIETGKDLEGRILVMPVAKNEGKAREMLGNTPVEDDFYEGKPRMIEYKNKIIIAIGVKGKKDARKFGSIAWKAIEGGLGPVKFHLVPDFLEENKVLEGALLTSYKFSRHLTKREEKPWIVFHGSQDIVNEVTTKIKGVFIARDLSNEPPNIIYPESLAERVVSLFEGTGVDVEIHNYDWLLKNGFGGIVSVGKGSKNKPALIILKYLPKGEKPVLIEGKGISFDAGGINLKPTGYIETMKMDMSGAAVVVGTIFNLVKLGIKKDVIGIIPTAENMPGGEATRPSDVVKMYNKKTVEVWNTDAEGRMVLADGLAYGIERFKPSVTVDLATLTGACVVALGEKIAGLLGNDQDTIDEFMKVSKEVEEETWPLPMSDHFAELLKSDVADVRNSADKGYGGEPLELNS